MCQISPDLFYRLMTAFMSWKNNYAQPEFDAFISGCSKMQMHNGYTFDDGATSKLHHPEIETPSHWMPFKEPSP